MRHLFSVPRPCAEGCWNELADPSLEESLRQLLPGVLVLDVSLIPPLAQSFQPVLELGSAPPVSHPCFQAFSAAFGLAEEMQVGLREWDESSRGMPACHAVA